MGTEDLREKDINIVYIYIHKYIILLITLYIVYSIMYIVYYILNVDYEIQDTLYYILFIIYHILYIIFYILYSIYYVLIYINIYIYVYIMCRKSTVFYHFAGQPHGYQTSMDPCTEDTRWSTRLSVPGRGTHSMSPGSCWFMVGPGVVIKSGREITWKSPRNRRFVVGK